jgi:predicted Zn finger-like uncharacterized protein
MRLTCPNCTAQYEVEESVIPSSGRDVQCSACGHIWFQYPAEVSLAMRAAELEDDEDDDDAPEPAQGEAGAAATQIDRKVLDVLRDEARRELDARRKPGAGLETQGDLGLVTRPARPARGHRDETHPEEDDGPAAGTERPAPSRRNLLPDIEELSSTLEPGREPRRRGESETILPPTERETRRGFMQGFGLVALIFAALALLYVFAGAIAAQVPMLTEALRGYVGLVDMLRDWISTTLRGLLTGGE